MREIRDTFVHLLADNLPSDQSIPVHVLRDDPTDRAAGELQENAINLSFLNYYLARGGKLSTLQAVIDIINVDENTAVDWVQAVWDILGATFFTSIIDYSTPSAPIGTTKSMLWDSKQVAFKRVSSTSYTHYSCVLPLQFSAV